VRKADRDDQQEHSCGAAGAVSAQREVHRNIGEFARQPYSVTGEVLLPAEYEEHCKQMLPQEEDLKLVREIQATEPNWIAPKGGAVQ
jgi:hypothetical protein